MEIVAWVHIIVRLAAEASTFFLVSTEKTGSPCPQEASDLVVNMLKLSIAIRM
jgi:hypothetical protein